MARSPHRPRRHLSRHRLWPPAAHPTLTFDFQDVAQLLKLSEMKLVLPHLVAVPRTRLGLRVCRCTFQHHGLLPLRRPRGSARRRRLAAHLCQTANRLLHFPSLRLRTCLLRPSHSVPHLHPVGSVVVIETRTKTGRVVRRYVPCTDQPAPFAPLLRAILHLTALIHLIAHLFPCRPARHKPSGRLLDLRLRDPATVEIEID